MSSQSATKAAPALVAPAEPFVTDKRFKWSAGSIGFYAMQILGLVILPTLLAARVLEYHWWDLAICVGLYWGRMIVGVAMGYHRYFSHPTFRFAKWCRREAQYLLAWCAQSTFQRGTITWATDHRRHHEFSDMPGDPHSAKLDGFWWSHMGWITARNQVKPLPMKDLTKYPELVRLNKYHWLPGITLATFCYFAGYLLGDLQVKAGLTSLLWFFTSTAALIHGTSTINSLAHRAIRWWPLRWLTYRRYETDDESQNCIWLIVVVAGEQWHNTHHAFQTICRQGERWLEIDVTYYLIKTLKLIGVIEHINEHKPKPAIAQA